MNKNIIIDACIPSAEMNAYLKTQDINERLLAELIIGAHVALNQKLELYALLSDEYASILCAETKEVLAELELNPGEIFTLTECWYDEEILDEKKGFGAVFTTFAAAMKYLQDEIEAEEWDDTCACWTELSKWVPDANGAMKQTYTYYLVRDEVVYFKDHNKPSHHQYQGYISSMWLELPIPFKVGDIATLNCLPFAPVKQALLTEVDNFDCCGVQMLFLDTDGKWKTGALKHGHGWGNYYPILSPLYRLEKFEGDVNKNESLLKQLQYSLRKEKSNGI